LTYFNKLVTDVTVKYIWVKKGTFITKVKAEDAFGFMSLEATLSLTMSRNRAITFNSLMLKVLERFSLL
jgi:hypothetical protein